MRSHLSCIVAALAAVPAARAQPPCPALWHDTGFEPAFTASIGSFVITSSISAAAIDETTSPPTLLASGLFDTVFGEPVSCIARWDGIDWSAVGAGLDGPAYAISHFGSSDATDGRLRQEVVVGGDFEASGDASLANIARWTGEQWLPLGGGLDSWVYALCVFDDGDGPALYAGGEFTHADGQPANHIARWNGATWSAVGVRGGGVIGGGVDGAVRALAVFDDGSGPRLFAAGQFINADGAPAKHVAAFNGKEWSSVGVGLPASARALAVFNPGGGPRLYAGGAGFSSWNGSDWTTPATFNAEISALHSTTIDGAATLLVGGAFTQITQGGSTFSRSHIAGYDGSTWKAMGSTSNTVRAIASVPAAMDSIEPATVFIGGAFVTTNGGIAEGIAHWDGTRWMRASPALPGFWANNKVYDMVETTIDGESAVVIGGAFRGIGDIHADGVALWRHGRFEAMGDGLDGSVFGLLVSAIEPGVIYAAGSFEDGDGNANTRHGLMRWDGATWMPMATIEGAYTGPYGYAIAEFDDGRGGGPALYLAGTFLKINGVASPCIARFDGTNWSPVGVPFESFGQLWALAVYDAGDGPRLCASGTGTPSDRSVYSAVKSWDGVTWAPVGDLSILDNPWALAVHDDGSGSKLYIAGDFAPLYRWDGRTVETVGTVGSNRRRLRVHDFGSGPTLVIAGFQGPTTPAIAAWNGSAVVPIPGVLSINSIASIDGEVWTTASLPDGRLAIGGWFRWMNEVPGSRPMACLAVYDPSAGPWIVDHPDDAIASTGETIAFSVALFEKPPTEPVTYAWRRNGIDLRDGGAIAGATTETLVLTVRSAADAGLYDVIVSNDCGESVSAAATLIVTCAGDVDGDGAVDGADLGALLGGWGMSDPTLDLNGDGIVDAADLAVLVAAWGGC